MVGGGEGGEDTPPTSRELTKTTLTLPAAQHLWPWHQTGEVQPQRSQSEGSTFLSEDCCLLWVWHCTQFWTESRFYSVLDWWNQGHVCNPWLQRIMASWKPVWATVWATVYAPLLHLCSNRFGVVGTREVVLQSPYSQSDGWITVSGSLFFSLENSVYYYCGWVYDEGQG